MLLAIWFSLTLANRHVSVSPKDSDGESRGHRNAYDDARVDPL